MISQHINANLTLSIRASCDKSSLFLLKHKLRSVDARICDNVPNRWNNMAVNWMTRIRAKKKTNTSPMGSSCRYSLLMCTCNGFGCRVGLWLVYVAIGYSVSVGYCNFCDSSLVPVAHSLLAHIFIWIFFMLRSWWWVVLKHRRRSGASIWMNL